MDLTKLVGTIAELKGDKDIELADMRVDGNKIFIELDLVEPAPKLIEET